MAALTECRVCGVLEKSRSGQLCTKDALLIKVLGQTAVGVCPDCGDPYAKASANDVRCGRCFAIYKKMKTKKQPGVPGTCAVCERAPVLTYHASVPVCFPCLTSPDCRLEVIAVLKQPHQERDAANQTA